jgi:hypothetical protein
MTLSGAITAIAIVGSPYETLKRAVFDALAYQNFSAEMYMAITVDSMLHVEETAFLIHGDNSSLSYSIDDAGNIFNVFYSTNDLSIHPLS